MDQSLRTTLVLTLLGCPAAHPLLAKALASQLECQETGTSIALYGLGSIARHLIQGHRVLLERLNIRLVATNAQGTELQEGFPLVNPDSLRQAPPHAVFLLSYRFEDEMALALEFMPPSKIHRLIEVIDRYGLPRLLEGLDDLLRAPRGEPDPHLVDLRTQIALTCAENRVEGWWRHTPTLGFWHFPDPAQCRLALRDLILRRSGQARLFLELSEKLTQLGVPEQAEDRFLIRMAGTFLEQLKQLPSLTPVLPKGRKPFLLAVATWGDLFVQRLLRICLPSLLEPHNLPALSSRREVILLIHTDPQGRAAIEASEAQEALTSLGISMVFLELDPELLSHIGDAEGLKYWHLGLVQSLHLAWARALKAEWHVLMPDHLYSGGYFTRLAALMDGGPGVVVQTLFRTSLEEMSQELAAWTHGSYVGIPPAQLAALGLNHQHPGNLELFMNACPKGLLPASHHLLWEGEEALHILAPHTTIAALDAGALPPGEDRFYYAIDSELDKVLPEGFPIRFPEVEDGLVAVELSPAEDGNPRLGYLAPDHYAARFWSRIESPRHCEFLNGLTRFPVDPRTRVGGCALPESLIQVQFQEVRRLVTEGRPGALPSALCNALEALGGKSPAVADSATRMLADSPQGWSSWTDPKLLQDIRQALKKLGMPERA